VTEPVEVNGELLGMVIDAVCAEAEIGLLVNVTGTAVGEDL
jgi:hypothetical protein